MRGVLRVAGRAIEVDRAIDLHQVDPDPDRLPVVLDHLLGLHPHRAVRRRQGQRQGYAVLRAPVTIQHPTGFVQQRRGRIRIVRPRRVGRGERFEAGKDVGGRWLTITVEGRRNQFPVDRQVQRLADHIVAEDRVRGVLLRNLAINFRIRVGEVHAERLDQHAGEGVIAALAAALFQLGDHFRLDLDVPGPVEITRLQHGPRRRRRIAATLKQHAGEVGFGRLAIVLVQDVGDLVVGGEAVDLERPGPDWVGQKGFVAIGGIVAKRVGRVDRTEVRPRERFEPGQRRVGEGHHGCQLVRRFDAGDGAPGSVVDRRVGVGGDPLPRELHVTRGERFTVGPGDIWQQGESDGRKILGQQSVLDRWHLGHEVRDDRAIGKEVQQWLHHQRGGDEILVARSTVWRGHARSLPDEQAQVAARASLLRLGAEGRASAGDCRRRRFG